MRIAIGILGVALNEAKSDLDWAIEHNDEEIKNDRKEEILDISEAIKILAQKATK